MIKLTDFLSAAHIHVDMSDYKVHLATGNPLDAFFKGEFKEWQEYQTKRNFPCKMVISLIELRKHKWLFAGVYKILSHEKKSEKHIAYQTELLAGQDNLIGRLIVHHKRAGRPSYLKGKSDGGDFEICEILPTRLEIEDFPGHNNVNISYSQLASVIQQGVQTWKGALSNVKGVYLITDTTNGKHYVGSATGSSGIWQRWSSYVSSGHGGNKELKILLKESGSAHKTNFQYSILEIADTHSTDDQIRTRESYWKNVLCSRQFGYNSN
ncbi:GIY-YIG nuclease family protein [Photobacterium leiognathi]|uniref:GIY-YIG nuclease family protein n=1 Tax=Photobacterium leiognathi TaxID=553611 RepID=UPI002980BB24|nr:GIY-YIG nuclease family protein [Photobacterium leiognathi]